MNVYDFDKTIYRNDSTVDFYLWQLARHPLLIRFRPKQLLGFFLYYGIHAINKTEMKNYFYCYLKALKDVDSDVVSFWDSHMKGINKWYLEKHRDDDVVISASATFLVKEACSRLGIRNVICSEVDPYSGEVMGENCNGAQKPIRFREEGFPCFMPKRMPENLLRLSSRENARRKRLLMNCVTLLTQAELMNYSRCWNHTRTGRCLLAF